MRTKRRPPGAVCRQISTMFLNGAASPLPSNVQAMWSPATVTPRLAACINDSRTDVVKWTSWVRLSAARASAVGSATDCLAGSPMHARAYMPARTWCNRSASRALRDAQQVERPPRLLHEHGVGRHFRHVAARGHDHGDMRQGLTRQRGKFYAIHKSGEVDVDENHHQRVAQMFHSDGRGLAGLAFDNFHVAFFQQGAD